MDEIEDSSEFENTQIKIDRVRHFIEFNTPSLINYTEEITFYNSGDEIPSIVFDLENFRSNLHIFDSDGTPLIFYGNGNGGESHEISIDFSNAKLIKKDEYRTIIMKYQMHALEKQLTSTFINIFLYEGASIYVSLKECDDYEFNIQYISDNIQLENNVLINGNGIKNCNIYSKATENNDNNMYIRIVHSIPKSLSYWYILGISLGVTIFIFNWPFYHFNPTGIRYFAIISATVISLLVVIKGWLFQKEMVKRVAQYDKWFLRLIFLIFLEIFLMICHFSFIFGK